MNAAIKHPGMGAIPGAQGVTFRVWAPHAEKVYVIGSFNDWNETSTSLVSEKNGTGRLTCRTQNRETSTDICCTVQKDLSLALTRMPER